MITQSRLREVFDYQDGNLIWKKRTSKKIKIGINAGCLATGNRGKQYILVRVDKTLYAAHRLIWIWHYGDMTKPEIDHIDGNGLNNKIENLRQAERKENTKNLKISCNNKSGVTGVSWCKEREKWEAYIKVDKKRKALGRFVEIEDAICARKEAEKKYFGEWARKVF